MSKEFVTTVHLDKPSKKALSSLRVKLGKKTSTVLSSSEVMRTALVKLDKITN